LYRMRWTAIFVFVFSGCFSISSATRDADEDEWGARWGSDDVETKKQKKKTDEKGGSELAQPEPLPEPETKPGPKPEPKPERKVAKIKKTTSKQPRPVKKAPKVEDPPDTSVPVKARAPVVMYPPENEEEEPPLSKEPLAKKMKNGEPISSGQTTKQGGSEPELREKSKAPDSEPLLFMDAQGGILIPRNVKVQPAVGVGIELNLGRFIGWKGLYFAFDADIIMGETQLGNTSFVMLDTLFGLRGRFALGPIKLLAGLGFGLRNAFVTGSDDVPTGLGFGAVLSGGIEIGIWGPLSIVVEGDGRYMKDPFTSKFAFSSMVGGGLGVEF
jgi:hypothetical protein